MNEPFRFSRHIRRLVEREGLRADVAADVNIVIASNTGGAGATATARQDTSITQGRKAPKKEQS